MNTMYRKKITILNHGRFHDLCNSLECAWPQSSVPSLIDCQPKESDLVLIFANGYEELLQVLPLLLELQYLHTKIVLACNSYGELQDLMKNIDVVNIRCDTDPVLLAGMLFGLLECNEENSLLRGKIGLIKNLYGTLQEDIDLLQDELNTASLVQREFMSNDVQSVHGASFSSLWRPIGVVSGDMFDITQLDDDHVGIFIADAIGHGISAAMLAMMLTRTLAANRFDSQTRTFTAPKEMLKYLNAALLQRSGNNARFATAAYGIFNCSTNQLTYAGAGHPPALLCRLGEEPILLNSKGPLLGVFDHDDFPQEETTLLSGDTLLLYSDGLEQCLGGVERQDGQLPRYLQSMHEFCMGSGSDILGKIHAYLCETVEMTADDDATMVCLRASGTPIQYSRVA